MEDVFWLGAILFPICVIGAWLIQVMTRGPPS